MDIAGDGGKIVLAVMVRAVVRVAVVIKSNFFNCMFGGVICGIGVLIIIKINKF